MTERRPTHVRADGSAHMVDVSGKDVTARGARAAGCCSPRRRSPPSEPEHPQGDALAVARVAGIQAVKRTPTSSRWRTPSPSTASRWRLPWQMTASTSRRRCSTADRTGSRWRR